MTTVGLFELELMSNAVWIESSEFRCGDFNEKTEAKNRKGRRVEHKDENKILLSVERVGKRTVVDQISRLIVGQKDDCSKNEI